MSKMSYKGYTARIEFDERDDIFVGRILGISAIIGFHADTVQTLRTAFEEAVDDYIETSAKLGKPVEKPASGKIMLRMPPEVHSAALVAAKAAGTSLNQWAVRVFDDAAHALKRLALCGASFGINYCVPARRFIRVQSPLSPQTHWQSQHWRVRWTVPALHIAQNDCLSGKEPA